MSFILTKQEPFGTEFGNVRSSNPHHLDFERPRAKPPDLSNPTTRTDVITNIRGFCVLFLQKPKRPLPPNAIVG